MPTYFVKQGDHLFKIAQKHGFADYHTIWDHPKNAELKRKRQNPNVLYPGDRLYIPEKELKEESGATEQRHRFKTRGETLMLRIVLKNIDGQPIANEQCDLDIEGEVYPLITDGEGQIEQQIPKSAERGSLTLKDTDLPFDVQLPLKIGHLDPVDTASGQQARLNNLGYNAGEVGGTDPLKLRSAVEEFQCDYDLSVDGICGSQTQAKLEEVHGC